MKKAKIGAMLPHISGKYGGVRRYIELGNAFVDLGYEYELYVANFNNKANWREFKGEFKDLIKSKKIEVDFLLCSEPSIFHFLPRVTGDIYIYVNGGGKDNMAAFRRVYKRYPFVLNNRIFYKWFPNAYLVEGGVDTSFWKPKWKAENRKPRVAYYNAVFQNKGEAYIRKELTGIVDLVPFCGLDDKKLRELYWNIDYFVSAEHQVGWANPAIEAISCGVPVVVAGINCEPFENGVIKVKSLRQFFKHPALEFDWHNTAKQFLDIWEI